MPRWIQRLQESPRPLRIGLLLAAIAALVGLVGAAPPVREAAGGFDSPDQREFLGLPNAANVLSNLPFAFVGILGLARLRVLERNLRPAAALAFAAIAAVVVGSSFYHLAPSPERLLVDRLPIAIAFQGLFAWVLGDRLAPRLARAALLPLLALALAALWIWRGSGAGDGDLRPYVLVQAVPLTAIPLLAVLFPGALCARRLCLGLVLYLAGMAFQFFDGQVFALGGVVSGHTLKHLASAVACCCLLPAAAPALSRPCP